MLAAPRPGSPHDNPAVVAGHNGLADGALNDIDDELLEDPMAEGEIVGEECDV